MPPPTMLVPATSANIMWPNLQFQYQSNTKDLQLISELEKYLMKGTLSLTTPAHLLTASPTIHRVLLNKLKVQHVETNEYKAVTIKDSQPLTSLLTRLTIHKVTTNALVTINQPPTFCLPLQELDILVNSSIKVLAILDTGLQIIIIWLNIVQSLGVKINHQCLIEMEGVNGTTN